MRSGPGDDPLLDAARQERPHRLRGRGPPGRAARIVALGSTASTQRSAGSYEPVPAPTFRPSGRRRAPRRSARRCAGPPGGGVRTSARAGRRRRAGVPRGSTVPASVSVSRSRVGSPVFRSPPSRGADVLRRHHRGERAGAGCSSGAGARMVAVARRAAERSFRLVRAHIHTVAGGICSQISQTFPPAPGPSPRGPRSPRPPRAATGCVPSMMPSDPARPEADAPERGAGDPVLKRPAETAASYTVDGSRSNRPA
jgi:hypothetical protein